MQVNNFDYEIVGRLLYRNSVITKNIAKKEKNFHVAATKGWEKIKRGNRKKNRFKYYILQSFHFISHSPFYYPLFSNLLLQLRRRFLIFVTYCSYELCFIKNLFSSLICTRPNFHPSVFSQIFPISDVVP